MPPHANGSCNAENFGRGFARLVLALSGNVFFVHPQSLTNQEWTKDQLKSGDHPFPMLWTMSSI
jgi:hypothetical protein